MIRFWSILANTFVQAIRQPIFGVLLAVTFLVLVVDVPLSGWTMGTDYNATNQKLLINLGLSTLLAAGLLVASFSAAGAVSREIEDRTALTVISKPVSRTVFVLGKFAGLACASALAFYLAALAFLMTVRHQVTPAATDPIDWPVIVLGLSAVGAAVMAALAGNYLFGWTFTSAAVWTTTILLTVAMGLVTFLGKGWTVVPPGYDTPPQPKPNLVRLEVRAGHSLESLQARAETRGYTAYSADPARRVLIVRTPVHSVLSEQIDRLAGWDGVAASGPVIDPPVITADLLGATLLTFMAVLILVAVAVAASTRLGQIATLLLCLSVFVVGSLHPALFGRWRQDVPAAGVLGWIVPNLTYFFALDALMADKPIPGSFLAAAAAYCGCCVAAALAIGVALFQRRQLEPHGSTASMPPLVGLLAWIGRAVSLATGLAGLAILSMPKFHTLTGMILCGGLLAGAAVGWILWGLFARGVKWSYRLVLAGTAALLAAALVALLAPHRAPFLPLPADPALRTLLVVLLAAVAAILGLPGTRRHFHSESR